MRSVQSNEPARILHEKTVTIPEIPFGNANGIIGT